MGTVESCPSSSSLLLSIHRWAQPINNKARHSHAETSEARNQNNSRVFTCWLSEVSVIESWPTQSQYQYFWQALLAGTRRCLHELHPILSKPMGMRPKGRTWKTSGNPVLGTWSACLLRTSRLVIQLFLKYAWQAPLAWLMNELRWE